MNKNNENIFPPELAIEALKYGPYSNSASAIAEIIDNSVDAGAETIHVAVIANDNAPISVAVLDDGNGMDENALRRSIQYGYGTKEEANPKQRKKWGRFGVGLISASINQCNELNVWSWTKGMILRDGDVRAANKTSINVNDIRNSGKNILPKISEEILPEGFMGVFRDFPGIQENAISSGTLVEWQDFHNLTWKRANTLCDHVKNICGRVYRNHIRDKKLQIVMLVFDQKSKEIVSKEIMPAVDPMFLNVWENKELKTFSSELSMFRPFLPSEPESEARNEDGTPKIIKRQVFDENGGLLGEYRLQFSHRRIPQVVQRAKDKDIARKDPGEAPFGKLANRLKGVSILREGRELALNRSWLRDDSTIDRWIKASIDFSPALDSYFGVSHNKQAAIHLDSLASISLQDLKSSDFDGAHNQYVLDAAIEIKEGLNAMRRKVSKERLHERTSPVGNHPQAPEDVSPENLSDLSTRAQKRAEKHPTPDDSKKPDWDGLIDVYEETQHAGKKAADVRPKIVIDYKLKVDFVASEKDLGASIFTARQKNGMALVILNQDHPLYAQLSGLLLPANGNGDANGDSAKVIQEKLNTAIWVLLRLFFSFARAECEAHSDKRDEFEEVRVSWGRVAKSLLKNEDD